MSILNENAQSGVESVFDHDITDDERIRLSLPTRETYLEIFEGDTASVNTHPRPHPGQPRYSRRVYQTPPRRQTQRSPRNHHERHLVLLFMWN